MKYSLLGVIFLISVRSFGKTPEGQDVQLFLLENNNVSVYITDFGAHIVSFNVPDKNGILTDIVLGFDNVEAYAGNIGYIGATVGRFANRIENGRFNLNGVTYNLCQNNGAHHLHGGKEGFNHKIFKSFVDGEKLILSYESPDMEEGYPGNLDFKVSFELTNDALVIEYDAICDKDTVANFTNHAYFNLNGALSQKTIKNHYLQVNADAYCKADSNALANGIIAPVRNTDMDLKEPKLLKDVIESSMEDIASVKGLDHNFVLSMQRGIMKKAAEIYSPDSGILLECHTDQPGIQIYTSNSMDLKNAKGMCDYSDYMGVCLETQGFPNSTSFSYFPSPIIRAGERFTSKTIYKFSNK